MTEQSSHCGWVWGKMFIAAVTLAFVALVSLPYPEAYPMNVALLGLLSAASLYGWWVADE